MKLGTSVVNGECLVWYTTPEAATKFNNELTLKLKNVGKAIQDNGISVLDTQQLFHPEDLQEWDKGEKNTIICN